MLSSFNNATFVTPNYIGLVARCKEAFTNAKISKQYEDWQKASYLYVQLCCIVPFVTKMLLAGVIRVDPNLDADMNQYCTAWYNTGKLPHINFPHTFPIADIPNDLRILETPETVESFALTLAPEAPPCVTAVLPQVLTKKENVIIGDAWFKKHTLWLSQRLLFTRDYNYQDLLDRYMALKIQQPKNVKVPHFHKLLEVCMQEREFEELFLEMCTQVEKKAGRPRKPAVEKVPDAMVERYKTLKQELIDLKLAYENKKVEYAVFCEDMKKLRLK